MSELQALDLVPEGVLVVDPDGIVTHANRRAVPLLQLPDEVAGRPLTELLDVRDDAGRTITHCLIPPNGVGDRIPERTVQLRLSHGARRPLSLAGTRFPEGGGVLTFRHAGRRERVDAVRSDLVATVSHEIRSPLTTVKGFTRTLLAKWDRFSDDSKRAMLETINEDADRVTRLLTDLLDASRIDAGRVQLDRRLVSLIPLIHSVVEKSVHDADVPVTVEEPETPLDDLYLDPDKTEQILTNLIENALRHAPGSPVRISFSDGDEVVCRVEDRGPGIPPEQRGEVFTKFSSGRGPRRTGTGLGLFITRGLVEAHGGRVWVESTDGGGATFCVALPKGGIELAR